MFKKLFSRKKPEAIKPLPELLRQPTGPVVNRQHDDVDFCVCGSGKFFKSCCGSREQNRPPPHGIFVFNDFISPKIRQKIMLNLDNSKGHRLKVIDHAASTPEKVVNKFDDQRVTESIEFYDKHTLIVQLVKDTFTQFAEQCYSSEIEWIEQPQILRYTAGGYYHGHADSENVNPESGRWEKVIDRDLSLLLYLNDEFEGGDLFFEKFNFTLQPEAGMAVVFPSDNRYMHTAEQVYDGVRYVVVSWAAIKGINKICQQPPDNAIVL